MEKQNKLVLSEEQLDALVQSLLPVMQEFFSSESGKKIWADQLEGIAPESKKICGLPL